MELSNELLSQFAKLTKSENDTKKETTVYGTVKLLNNKAYVKIDGAPDEVLTPIPTTEDGILTAANVRDGDRVTVMIKNHTMMITGNISSPAAGTSDLEDTATKADNALTYATEANSKVNEAQTAANEAQTKANEAIAAAETATTEAAEALTKAKEASSKAALVETNLSGINEELDSVQEDAAELRSELETGLETVRNEMSTTYAKKTDLSSTETTLRSEIAQSATQIQQTVEQTYAKQTEVDDALVEVETKLQTQITQNADSITSLAKSIEEMDVDVTDQNGKISEAIAAAESAQNTADAAKVDATQAQTAADNAQTAADAANQAAATAQSAADAAKADLVAAQTKLKEVEGDVNSTQEDIKAAQEAVRTAQTAADNAQTAADNAATSASNANTAAANAQTKANEAKTAADNAQAAADEAKEDLEALEKRVTIAETAIEQNSKAITLRATKTELAEVKDSAEAAQDTADGVKNDLSNNYYTKSQTESKISVESEAIKSSVSDLDDRVTSAESSITQLSNKITTNVTETTNLGKRMTTVEQTAGDLTVRLDTAEDDITTAQSTANTAKSNAATAQATANAAKKQLYHYADGTSGTTGYVAFCTIVVKSNYVNRPILFELNNRGKQSSNVSFCFKNAASIDPELLHLQYDGGINVWAYKTGTSTWQIIAQKSEGYDTIYVKDFTNNNASATVTWTNVHYDSLPTSNITAGTLLAAKIEKTVVDNAAKTATNYLNFSNSGLVVGNHTASSLGKNVLIDSDSVDIRNGTTTLASFGGDTITLGQNAENSSIDLCDGAGTISTRTSEASTSWPKRNAILIDSQEIETESLRFVASTSNAYGETTTPTVQRGTELYMIRSASSGESCARLKAEHKNTSSGAYTNAGISAMTYDAASSTRAMVYASDSANSTYNQVNVYPTKTTMNKNLVLNGTTFTGKNKVLWSGTYYMTANHTATLSEAVSSQTNGIVLLFSRYSSGAAQNHHFQSFFVPKCQVTNHKGCGHTFLLSTDGYFGLFAAKYLYINDTNIAGNAVNNAGGTGDCGIKYTNNGFVLRYVIGV